MSYAHDEHDDDLRQRPRESEVTLGTGTILGIFFGLVVLCGAFFGFGYSLGSKVRPVGSVTTNAATATPPNFGSFKPSSGTPAMQTAPAASSTDVVTPGTIPKTAKQESAESDAAVVDSVSPASPSTSLRAHEHSPGASAPAVRVAPVTRPAVPAADTAPAGTFMVQVAAVTHPEDAELLIGALKRKGYAVTSHTETQDKLFHIQVGPFASKAEAEAMKQRLLTDGYKAFLK